MEILLHVLTPEEHARWQAAPSWQPPSLATQGFVHLCTKAQLAGVRERFYRDAPVVVLVLDAAKLDVAPRWEDTMVHGVFPHLYTGIPRGAVAAEVPLAAGAALPGAW